MKRTIASSGTELFMNNPRKKPNTSFLAQYTGVCTKCHQEIQVGDRVQYDDEGLHHTTHKKIQKTEEVCSSCWLVKPCECA